MKKIDMAGKKFGRLTVISEGSRFGKEIGWFCECECGTQKNIRGSMLRSGRTKSCGCFREENRSNLRRTHGLSHTPLYGHWADMVSRCHNEKDTSYKNYGGRGITVCKEWRENIESFFKWSLSNGYEKGLTIERNDNEKGYEPSNCGWITKKEQLSNTRRNVFIEINGETKTMSQWSRKMNIPNRTLYGRYKRGDRGRKLIRPVQAEYAHNIKERG